MLHTCLHRRWRARSRLHRIIFALCIQVIHRESIAIPAGEYRLGHLPVQGFARLYKHKVDDREKIKFKEILESAHISVSKRLSLFPLFIKYCYAYYYFINLKLKIKILSSFPLLKISILLIHNYNNFNFI